MPPTAAIPKFVLSIRLTQYMKPHLSVPTAISQCYANEFIAYLKSTYVKTNRISMRQMIFLRCSGVNASMFSCADKCDS